MDVGNCDFVAGCDGRYGVEVGDGGFFVPGYVCVWEAGVINP